MKNPFLSFWLSGANSWAGAMRGLWMAEISRQQTALLKQTMELWTGAWAQPKVPAPAKSSTRTRR
jgi:hypothetical protein